MPRERAQTDTQSGANGDPTEGGDIYVFRGSDESRLITYREIESTCRSLKLDNGTEVQDEYLHVGQDLKAAFRFKAKRLVPWFGTMVNEPGQFGTAVDTLLAEWAMFDRASRMKFVDGRTVAKPRVGKANVPYMVNVDEPGTIATMVTFLEKGVLLNHQGNMNPIQRAKAIKVLTEEGAIVPGAAKAKTPSSKGKAADTSTISEDDLA